LLRLSGSRPAGLATQWAGLVAAAFHFAGLVAYTAQQSVLPLEGLAPALSSLAFLSGLLTVGVVWLTGEVSILLLGLPLVMGPLGIALVAGFDAPTAQMGGHGGWFLLHTALSLLGIAFLGVSCVAAALYLLQHRELKQRRFGVIFQFVPPLEQLDRLNHLALVIGFPSLTLGILLALASTVGGGQGVELSLVHVGWGALSWTLLGLIAILRVFGRLRGRRAALASAGAFGVVAVSYLVLLAWGGEGARFL
jgi:ABC-type uncharacterized transport system permease subunit